MRPVSRIVAKPSAKFTSFNPLYPSTNAFDVATHYFQIGGMTIRPMGTLEPFLGLTVGVILQMQPVQDGADAS